jgi:hypothetical protein
MEPRLTTYILAPTEQSARVFAEERGWHGYVVPILNASDFRGRKVAPTDNVYVAEGFGALAAGERAAIWEALRTARSTHAGQSTDMVSP